MNNIELDKKVKQIAINLIYEKGYECAVDMLLRLECLKQADYELWRFGKIAYLKRACNINLNKLTRITNNIKRIARDSGLKKSWTCYKKYGKGRKTILRFTKSGYKNMEDDYATHYIDNKRINEIKINKAGAKPVIEKALQEDTKPVLLVASRGFTSSTEIPVGS